jgi:O-antigen/teichoic acid export membrane protein
MTSNLLNPRLLNVVDQLLLSAIGFGTSVIIVKALGVEQLGIYSAFLVVVTLLQTCFSSVCSGQMLLFISSKSSKIVSAFFRLTSVMWCVWGLILLVFAGITYTALILAGQPDYALVSVLSLLCVWGLSLFEQNRKLLYVLGKYQKSVTITLVFVVAHVFLILILATRFKEFFSVSTVFASLALSYFIACLVNTVFWHYLKAARKIKSVIAWLLFKRFLVQGKFAMGGLVLSWIQNQSISLILLVFFGPRIAGLFSLGRLVVTPVTVINLGLTNGLLPTLRRLAANKQYTALYSLSKRYTAYGLGTVLLFGGLTFLAFQFDWVLAAAPELQEATHYIVLWFAISSIVIWRTWATQFFIALLEFKKLLRLSIISTLATTVGIFSLIFLGFPALIVALMVLFGEVLILLMINRERNQYIKTHNSAVEASE